MRKFLQGQVVRVKGFKETAVIVDYISEDSEENMVEVSPSLKLYEDAEYWDTYSFIPDDLLELVQEQSFGHHKTDSLWEYTDPATGIFYRGFELAPEWVKTKNRFCVEVTASKQGWHGAYYGTTVFNAYRAALRG